MDQFLSQYFDFNFMFDHFDKVLDGFGHTLLLWAVAGALSLVWGLVLSLLRQLPGKPFLPVRVLTITYIDAFRGIPLLLVVVLIAGGFGALSAGAAPPGPVPESIAVPDWLGEPSAFWYGVMAITITYGAYMAEVYRAGIEAVPEGQMEAARSLGMTHRQAMRNVIVPQAVRKVFAPLLNDFIALMKDTTLVSILALNEVVQIGRNIQSATFNSSALLLGSLMFLVVILPLARVVDRMIAKNQRFTRGAGAGGR